jgi:hypothetical protein
MRKGGEGINLLVNIVSLCNEWQQDIRDRSGSNHSQAFRSQPPGHCGPQLLVLHFLPWAFPDIPDHGSHFRTPRCKNLHPSEGRYQGNCARTGGRRKGEGYTIQVAMTAAQLQVIAGFKEISMHGHGLPPQNVGAINGTLIDTKKPNCTHDWTIITRTRGIVTTSARISKDRKC